MLILDQATLVHSKFGSVSFIVRSSVSWTSVWNTLWKFFLKSSAFSFSDLATLSQ